MRHTIANCFITILHLANEKSLYLKKAECDIDVDIYYDTNIRKPMNIQKKRKFTKRIAKEKKLTTLENTMNELFVD